MINDNYKKLIKLLYYNFKEYFESGDIIFTGSIVYYKLGLIDKNNFSDIDISIIEGKYGDMIVNKIKYYFENNNFDFNVNYIERNWDNLKGICITDYGLIDILRGKKGDDKSILDINLFDDIKTKYYGLEFEINNIINCLLYNINKDNENRKNQYDKFYNLLSKIYSDKKHLIKDTELLIKLKWIFNESKLTTDEINILLSIKPDYDYIIRFIYNNFKEYFDSGDIIFTGSIIYNKLGIINHNNYNDIDISIISGEKGDKILYKLIKFFDEHGQIMFSKFLNNNWYNKIGNFYTKKGMIDVFRDDHNNKNNESVIQLSDNISTKFYGYGWIYNIINNNIIYLENDLLDNKYNQDIINFKNNQIYKFKNTLKIIEKYM